MHDIERFDAAVEEWGIQYVDKSQPMMSGYRTVNISAGSEQEARTAATWTHGSWKDREAKVVRRLVTPWEER